MSDATIAVIVSGVVQVAIGGLAFLTLWVKLRYGVEEPLNTKADALSGKMDDNTTITVQGNSVAASNAQTAASVAASAKTAVDQLDKKLEKKLNGGIDDAISKAIDPVHVVLQNHTAQIAELNEYVHTRNHEILSALQSHTNKLEAVLVLLREQHPK